MKQISQLKFSREFSVTNPDSIVREGDQKFITDDLYIIRSVHRKRDYSHYNPEDSSEVRYIDKPVFKLLSVKCDSDRASQDRPQICILSWDDTYVYSLKRDTLRQYGPKDCANYVNSNGIFDVLYYMLKPLKLRHANGNLVRGFRNHLITRLNGFGADSCHTVTILHELRKEVENKQTDMFETDTLDEMRAYVYNNGQLEQCPITKVIRPRSHLEWTHISGVRCYRDRTLNMEDYGYTMENHCWLKENEIMIDGTCYDSRTVNVIRCDGCNAKCVEQETRDGECVECIGRDYRIHNYSHRVEETLGFDKHSKKASEPYMGIELEYQADKPKGGRLYTGDKLKGHALMKDDGSIRNGFEIVTRPAGYWTHVNKLSSFLDDLPEHIHPHTSCGMHVHISRTAFTFLGAGKFTEFFNRPENKKFVKLIAGRGETQYQKADATWDLKIPYNQAIKDYSYNRYNFVNVSNRKTLELRIFATPANKMEFMIRMQFVKAMVEYCKPAQLSVPLREQTHYESFCNWLDNTRNNSYEILNNFIKESTICA